MNNLTTVNAERFKGQCFFALTLHKKFGNRARVTDGAKLAEYIRMKAMASDEASPTLAPVVLDGKAKATITLVSSPPLDTLLQFMDGIKDMLVGPIRGMANRSQIQDGLYSVSLDLVTKFEEILENANAEIRTKLRPAFIADYPAAVERARTLPIKDGGLGPLWNEGSYPNVYSLDRDDTFCFSWRWVALKVPEGLPEGIRQSAQEKLEKQLSDAADEITFALRESFRDLIAHASERLESDDSGKPRKFRDSMIGNIQDFISTFTFRNVMNDQSLNALVEQAKKILTESGASADLLRKEQGVRTTVKSGFEEIKAKLDTLIIERPSRRNNMDE